jgi:hypothetical protein
VPESSEKSSSLLGSLYETASRRRFRPTAMIVGAAQLLVAVVNIRRARSGGGLLEQNEVLNDFNYVYMCARNWV